MAELATIARPYADALFKATPVVEQSAWVEQVTALAAVARDPSLRDFADNPRVTQEQVFGVITGAAKVVLAPAVANLPSYRSRVLTDANGEKYVRYMIARLSAYRNVWWSLANEWDVPSIKTAIAR